MRTPRPQVSRRRAWIHVATVGVVLALGVGCGARAAEKLIDPRLRETGELLEREGRGRALVFGAYRVAGLERSEELFGDEISHGPLAPDAGGRTRPTQQVRLRFGLVGGPRTWRASCVGQRRQPPDHDFAAVADELRDEVALRCELTAEVGAPDTGEGTGEGGESERWVLSLDGRLADNLLGELVEQVELAEQLDTRPASRRAVEVVMWHRLWNISRRHLPASLVAVRSLDGGQTDAALIMTAREQVVLDPSLGPDGEALVLATMLAIRLMPLGFDA